MRNPVQKVLNAAYGLYAVGVFALLGAFALLILLLPLGLTWRRKIAHLASRGSFLAAVMPLRVRGLVQLPTGPCVVVANHASYLDGIVLKAALPARFTFVIKKEITKVPIAALLLRRIGSQFVDRFNRHAGAMDTRRLLRAADTGQALVFFPEGTFTAEPGLRKFQMGAFAIAARAVLPIVPVVVRGTRHILPSDRLLPRPGSIDVEVLPQISPTSDSDTAADGAIRRELARVQLLAALGEPDLAMSDDK